MMWSIQEEDNRAICVKEMNNHQNSHTLTIEFRLINYWNYRNYKSRYFEYQGYMGNRIRKIAILTDGEGIL